MIKFMLITNDPALAQYAQACGVERIFVDLERLGKQARQGHLDTFISHHTMADIAKVKANLTQAELLVRLNPLHDHTKDEIDEAIALGADILMLPMFHRADEVRYFSHLVNGRAKVMPLVETYNAAQTIGEIVTIQGVSEIYIGLNDLHLDMRLQFVFEPLANGLVDQLAKTIQAAGLPFGFGGVAKVGEGIIPGELVLAEHLRLGSRCVILSRAFHHYSDDMPISQTKLNLKNEFEKLLMAVDKLKLRSSAQVMADCKSLQTKVASFIANKV